MFNVSGSGPHTCPPILLPAPHQPPCIQVQTTPCLARPLAPAPPSRPALLLLLSFHNATFVTSLTPESPKEDLRAHL